MVNTPVLKIESENQPLLISREAKQEILPVSKNIIVKNINSEIIEVGHTTKFKTIIETKNDVNIEALERSKKFKIYSIIRFMQSRDKVLPKNLIEDSVETNDKFVTYRPIFDAILTNFSCKADTDNNQVWKLEFEEI